MKTIGLVNLQNLLDDYADKINGVINRCLKDDGDTEYESQRIVLINRIRGFQQAIIDIKESDIKDKI